MIAIKNTCPAVAMDAAYLKENVGEILALGLTQTLVRQPEDSVEYLANWLLDYVDAKEREEKKKTYVEEIILKDDLEQKREAKKQTILKQEEVAAVNDATTRGAQFENFLKEATDMQGLLQRFAELLKDACNASSVYFSRLSNDQFDLVGGEVSGQERDTSLDYLKYIVTTDEEKTLLTKKVASGEGITLELFEPEEPIPDEYEEYIDEETGEYLQRLLPKPEQPPKTVFVPNVLAGPYADRIKLFGLPKMGCFLGMRIQYDSCLHDAILDEADVREKEVEEQEQEEEERRLAEEEERKQMEAEEEEERRRLREEEDAEMTEEERMERDEQEAQEEARKLAEEAAKPVETEEEKEEREKKEAKAKQEQREQRLIDSLTKRKVGLVLCIDTVGQERRLSDAEVKTVLRMGKLLEKTLIRIDRDIFRLERKTREAIRDIMREAEPLSDEDRRNEIDHQYEQAKRIASDGEKPPSRDDIALQHRQHLLVGLRQQVLEFRAYNVCHGPISVLQAVMYLLNYPQDQVADSDNHAEWTTLRMLIDDEFIARIEELDMRAKYSESIVDIDPHERRKKTPKPAEGTPEYYTSIEGIEALIASVDPEDLQQRNFVLYELYGLVLDAIRVWKRADKEHRKHMALERARIKHEKEEAEEQARIKAEEEAMAHEGDEQDEAEEDYE